MSYKTILVQIDDLPNLESRIAIAADIAATENTHMIGLALTGVSRFLSEVASVAIDSTVIEPHVDALRKRAADALQKFETAARQMGVASFEARMVDDEVAGGISLQARCCDVVVLGRPNPDQAGVAVNLSFPEYVVMNSGVPALIVPYAGNFRKIGGNALVAWNGSVEATRAIHYALPLLQRAKTVEVAIFDPVSLPDVLDDPPGAYLTRYLACHNIHADVMTPTTDGSIGDALLALAKSLASDYLVMGCYGHARFRELILGGATANVLRSAPIPVLMAH